jgi:YVTN family beta-propeller protein
MDSTVSVIDIAASVVTKDIVVGTNPEGLVSFGGRLYVCNGAWGYGSSVSVIDQATDLVISTISTPSGPSYAVKGSSGVIHVLCTGYSPWGGGSPDVPGAILTIDGPTGTVLDTLWLTQPAGRIAADASGTLYVTGTSISGAAVWKVSGGLSPAVLSPTLVSGSFYGIGVDNSRSELYLASAGDFVGNGTVQVHTFAGTLSRTHTSGIGVVPNGFVFVP